MNERSVVRAADPTYGGFRAGSLSAEKLAASVDGWLNHVSHGNTVGLSRKLLEAIPEQALGLLNSGAGRRLRGDHYGRG